MLSIYFWNIFFTTKLLVVKYTSLFTYLFSYGYFYKQKIYSHITAKEKEMFVNN